MTTRARTQLGPPGFRRHGRARIGGITATVDSPSIPPTAHAVLDLSEGGMRLEGLDLPPGSIFAFALKGAPLSYRGEGRVVHKSDGTAGVAIERWFGSTRAEVAALVMSQLLASAAWRELYVSDWG